MKQITNLLSIVLIITALNFTTSCNKTNTNSKWRSEIRLDTLSMKDSAANCEVLIVTHVCNIPEFDTCVKNELLKQKDQFIENLLKPKFSPDETHPPFISSFMASPSSIYSDRKIVSYSFTVFNYMAGAAHPMTYYYSFNFDKKKKTKIGFNDCFRLTSKTDTTALLDIINKAINRKGVSLDSIYELDFNFIKDTISFNFDCYEVACYAEGIIQGKVAVKDLKPFLKK